MFVPFQPRHVIKFGQIYMSKPAHFEADGVSHILLPNDARLRNLSYTAPLYVDITRTVSPFVSITNLT